MNFEIVGIHFLRNFSLPSSLLLNLPISPCKLWMQIVLTISEEWNYFIAGYGDEGVVVDYPPSMNELLEEVLESLPVNNYMIAISVANKLHYKWSFLDYKGDIVTTLQEYLPSGKVFLIFLLSVWGN